MNNKYRVFTQCRKSSHDDHAKSLGFASWVVMQSRDYYSFRLVDVRAWLVPAIQHKQIVFFFDTFDTPIGYVTWANLAADAENRLLEDSEFLLHESEWDEGSRTWIIDCCFPFGDAAFAKAELRKIFISQSIDEVFWARRNLNYSVRKIVRWVV